MLGDDAVAGGQNLLMAALVLILDAVAKLGGQYLPMAVAVDHVLVVCLIQKGAECFCQEVFLVVGRC
jgi:hypothetical protein